ncbi:MAG: GvpL/GvpF family gas vesicle protein [Deltaproteobacteria bacterium]|nr:GvpL/GvpF family gas vesicle protein [Deltaproteobacteria bacterium]
MASKTSNNTGRYLYAIVAASETHNYGTIGMDDSAVYTISEGGVSAVVSNVPNQKMRPERRHLAAHQAVLRRLMKEITPLPMSFGIIAEGDKAITRILSANQEVFLKELRRVADKVEMGLRVTWDVPNIFEYFIQTHPELRTARDRCFGTHREPSHEEKLEVGRMFERMLNEDREAYTEKVEQILSEYCFEIKLNKSSKEREVMNLACLVGRKAQSQFEEGVFEAAKLFDNSFAFDYNGPWTPHNFVHIELAL